MRRLKFPLIILAVVALGLGLFVGGAGSHPAATVNGTGLSQSTLDKQLSTVTTSRPWLCYMNAAELVRSQGQSGLTSPTGAIKASYSTGFVSNWLNQQVTEEIIHQAASNNGLLPLTGAALYQAQSDLIASMDATLGQVSGSQYDCQATGTQVLGSMPKWFITEQIQAQAESEALLIATGGISLSAASVQAYYDAHLADFDTYCLSGIVVTSKADGATAKAALDGGMSMAEAATKFSKDTTSAAKGGVLGCFTPATSEYTRVASFVKDLKLGVASEPLANGSNAYLVLVVTSRTATPLKDVYNYVQRSILASDAAASSTEARRLIRSASVSVNPRYGTWSSSAALAGVVPPAAPSTKSLLNIPAITPGAEGF